MVGLLHQLHGFPFRRLTERKPDKTGTKTIRTTGKFSQTKEKKKKIETKQKLEVHTEEL